MDGIHKIGNYSSGLNYMSNVRIFSGFGKYKDNDGSIYSENPQPKEELIIK